MLSARWTSMFRQIQKPISLEHHWAISKRKQKIYRAVKVQTNRLSKHLIWSFSRDLESYHQSLRHAQQCPQCLTNQLLKVWLWPRHGFGSCGRCANSDWRASHWLAVLSLVSCLRAWRWSRVGFNGTIFNIFRHLSTDFFQQSRRNTWLANCQKLSAWLISGFRAWNMLNICRGS